MIGKLLQKNISERFHSPALSYVLEAILLLGLGMLAITLHAKWRYPLNIPGHHGMEFMAILMLGRSLSRFRFASGISSLGIGVLLLFPVFGFSDPMMGFNYMLPGFALDLLYSRMTGIRKMWPRAALVAGAAYLLIPASRLAMMFIAGFPYAVFLKHGFIVPLLSFFIFGAMGGLIGSGVSSFFKK